MNNKLNMGRKALFCGIHINKFIKIGNRIYNGFTIVYNLPLAIGQRRRRVITCTCTKQR